MGSLPFEVLSSSSIGAKLSSSACVVWFSCCFSSACGCLLTRLVFACSLLLPFGCASQVAAPPRRLFAQRRVHARGFLGSALPGEASQEQRAGGDSGGGCLHFVPGVEGGELHGAARGSNGLCFVVRVVLLCLSSLVFWTFCFRRVAGWSVAFSEGFRWVPSLCLTLSSRLQTLTAGVR